jgi:hypothetical protein
VLFCARGAIVSHEVSVPNDLQGDQSLTSSRLMDPGVVLHNRENDNTESFENSSRKEVRNESMKEPNVDVS